MTRADTLDALQHLDQEYYRLWHYRLYDTVSDPLGEIRTWLAQNNTQTWERTYPGSGFLRIERFALTGPEVTPQAAQPLLQFDHGLSLNSSSFPLSVTAGSLFYVNLHWQNERADANPNLSVSLRLYDQEGKRVAQVDEPLPQPATPGAMRQPIAIPVPAAAQPGEYTLALIAYDSATLAPLTPIAPTTETVDTAVVLGSVGIPNETDQISP